MGRLEGSVHPPARRSRGLLGWMKRDLLKSWLRSASAEADLSCFPQIELLDFVCGATADVDASDVSNFAQTPDGQRRNPNTISAALRTESSGLFEMWPYLQVLVSLCAVGLAGALCIGVVSFILRHSKFQA
jgi:hypothetical protein